MNSVARSLNSTTGAGSPAFAGVSRVGPDAIARGGQVHFWIPPQLHADEAAFTGHRRRGRGAVHEVEGLLAGGQDAHREPAGLAVVVLDGAWQRPEALERPFREGWWARGDYTR